jgi:hypothetical protein
MKHLILLSCLLSLAFLASGQKHLNKTISVNIKQKPLKTALIIVGGNGDFKFSYNSKILPKDSLVNIYAENKKVLAILRLVFDATYDFKEVGNFVIIRRKIVKTQNVVAQKPVQARSNFITGYIVDEGTGNPIPNVTIYEKMNLLSTMSDTKGYFSLKLKKKFKTAEISISKDNYIDTTINIVPTQDQKMTIALQEVPPVVLAVNENTGDTLIVERPESGDISENLEAGNFWVKEGSDWVKNKLSAIKTKEWLANGKFWVNEGTDWIKDAFVGSKQRIQNLNLKRFYTTRNWQLGLLPPISTHGRMNAQVVNKVSVNAIGGLSAGTDLVEVGGIYNINRKSVKYFQVAGIFNNVGGTVEGMQVAGIHNRVQDSISGVQVAGISNVSKEHMDGTQVSAIFNRAKSIKGIQIGLVNKVTDANTGWSLGIINISKGKNGRNRIGFLVRVPRKG